MRDSTSLHRPYLTDFCMNFVVKIDLALEQAGASRWAIEAGCNADGCAVKMPNGDESYEYPGQWSHFFENSHSPNLGRAIPNLASAATRNRLARPNLGTENSHVCVCPGRRNAEAAPEAQ